ncbi:MAG TPA: hypothetical protein VN723_13040 [Rhizomicrobium sp.]|nr:hypothetical protein [Rhizomicrobium sp.]
MLQKALLAAAFTPLLAACAMAEPTVTPQQTAAIEATCTKVVRLRPGQEFDACVSSLTDSVADLISADYANNAYRACANAGLNRETVEFSRCVLDHENTRRDAGELPAGAAAKLNTAFITPADSNPQDYFESSFPMRLRREQYACGTLGFEPDTGAFVSCVNKLDAEIFVVDHPNG